MEDSFEFLGGATVGTDATVGAGADLIGAGGSAGAGAGVGAVAATGAGLGAVGRSEGATRGLIFNRLAVPDEAEAPDAG